MNVTVIAGALQPYAWGRHGALAEFKPGAAAGPHAELWFGTHPAAASEHVAGKATASGQAPLLMKILAAASPLSIQVHPDGDGVRRLLTDSATAALLSDEGIKHEMLIAVESFDVLAGLRCVEEAAAVFEAAGPICADVVDALRDSGHLKAIHLLLTSPREADLDGLCAALPADEARIMRQVLDAYSTDAAVLVAFMLKPRTLQPGQAMYVPAGSVHAYVNGLGIEVMAASDNVLRLGLTPKTIAVDAALSISEPALTPTIGEVLGEPFAPDTAPFAVMKVVDSEITIPQADAIALAYDGSIHDPESGLTANKGQAFLIHAAGPVLHVHGTAYVAWPRG